MNRRNRNAWLILLSIFQLAVFAEPPPSLPPGTNPKNQSSKEQKAIPDLTNAYVSTQPSDLSDGINVGAVIMGMFVLGRVP